MYAGTVPRGGETHSDSCAPAAVRVAPVGKPYGVVEDLPEEFRPPTRAEVEDRAQRGELEGDAFFFACYAADVSPTEVRQEAERRRSDRAAGEAAAKAVLAVMRGDRTGVQRAWVDCEIAGVASEMRAAFSETLPGFEGSALDRDCERVSEMVKTAMTQQMAKRAAGVGRPPMRARAGLGVRTSSGQRRTRSANRGSSGDDDGSGEPGEPRSAAQPSRDADRGLRDGRRRAHLPAGVGA